MTTEVQQNSL